MTIVQPPSAREQLAALVGQMQSVGAPVECDAPQQAAVLQPVEQRHEVRLLDAERRARPRLEDTGVGVDHGQHGEMRRAQVELVEGLDEIREHLELGAPQRVPNVLGEGTELAGDLGMKRVHGPALRGGGALTPARVHGYIA